MDKVKSVYKLIAAAIGLVAGGLVQYGGVIPVQYQGYVSAFVALATLIGVYTVPNKPVAGKHEAAGHTGGTTGHPKLDK